MKIICLIYFLCISYTSENITTVSFYSDKHHGKNTASGEKFDMNKLTAAHKTLPFNTLVEITNLNNNKTVIVRINDRGPFVKGRKFDLSKAAFKQICPLRYGKIKVKYKIITNDTN
jgi:rare lipoprotein A